MDVTTLHITDALVNVTCGLMCLLLWNNQRTDHCFGWWGAGLTLFGLIEATYHFSATTPIANSAGYSLIDAATVAIWFGFRSFDGKRAMHIGISLMFWIPLATCLLVGALSGNWLLASKLSLAAHCGIAVAQATYVLKGSVTLSGPRAICAFAIYVIAASIAVPAVLEGAWLTEDQVDGFILIIDHAMTIVITLSIIAMVGERDFGAVLWASRHDPLTGLLNRKGLIEAVDRIKADQAVLMMDLDHFKFINDRFGHDGGDEVLRSFACRATATVGDRGLLARLGGEEFVVVSPSQSINDADVLAEEVRLETTREPVHLGEIDIPFTVSIGVSLRRANEDFFASVKMADEALYSAKEHGRDRVAHHSNGVCEVREHHDVASAGRRSSRRDLGSGPPLSDPSDGIQPERLSD